MRIDRVTVGPLDTNCWIVSDDEGGPAIVIDPGDDAQAIIATLGDRELSMVVLTHGHFDHVGAVGDLVAAAPAPIAIHEADAAVDHDRRGHRRGAVRVREPRVAAGRPASCGRR